jgi:hypothetical protein
VLVEKVEMLMFLLVMLDKAALEVHLVEQKAVMVVAVLLLA